jgi:hypothetical protein
MSKEIVKYDRLRVLLGAAHGGTEHMKRSSTQFREMRKAFLEEESCLR